MKKEEKNEEVKTIKINSQKSCSFFKRIWTSIFKLENYGEFVLEKTKIAISYFFKLILLVTVVVSIVSTYTFNTIVNKGFNYIKNEMPDFTFEDGMANFTIEAEGYDSDMDLFVLFVNKNNISENIKSVYNEKIKDYTYAIIFFQDEVEIYESGSSITYSYNELQKNYGTTFANKADLVELLDSVGILGITITYFVAHNLIMYVANIVTILCDIILVWLFGIIVSRLVGVRMPESKVFAISIYSLTLSIILQAIYSVVYSIWGFYVEYFDIMYLLVAYIYIIAAILIIKSDVIKQKIELQKIIEVQKQVKKELEEENKEETKEKDKKEEKNKENDKNEEEPVINGEPDGSEI